MNENVFEQVQHQKFYMQIARQIKHSIRDGYFKVGEMLPSERALAEQFGASRASIREALSALEMLGFIESRSGKGNFVKADVEEGSIDSELLRALLQGHDPFEIFEARVEIEPRLAGLAAERIDKNEVSELETLLIQQIDLSGQIIKELENYNSADNSALTAAPGHTDNSVKTSVPGNNDNSAKTPALRTALKKTIPSEESLNAFLENDRRLHLLIGRCSHNYVLETVFSALNAMMKETHWMVLNKKAFSNPEIINNYIDSHKKIISNIANGESKSAIDNMYFYIKLLQKEIFDM
jgi:DNA-binding FadR family transcriptional regulator